MRGYDGNDAESRSVDSNVTEKECINDCIKSLNGACEGLAENTNFMTLV